LKVNKLTNNVSFSIVNNILSLIVSIGSGMIIARMLGPAGKGTLYLITQIVSIGAVFFSMGIGPALLFYLRQSKFTKDQATTFSLVYSFIVSVVIVLLLFFLKDYLISLLNDSITAGMLVSGVVLIILNLLITFWGYVLMDNETGVKSWSIISVIGNLLYLIVLFALVFGFKKGINGALMALFTSCLLRIIILFRLLFLRGFSFVKMPSNTIQPIFKYALGIFIGNLFLTSVYRIDIFFVNNILSVSELGIYSASVNVSELLLLVPNAIGVALFPHLTSLEYNDRTLTMSRIGRLSMILGVAGSLAIVVIAYPFIMIVFGEKFKGAFIPTLLLLPGLVSMTLNYAYSNYLNSIGKPLMAAKIFSVGLVVNIVLNWFFLKKFGINGAAVFSSITYTIITIGFILVILKNDKHLKLKDIAIPNKEDFIYLINKMQLILKIKR
jgi:O-antigen/teichoic acid export membrane protein